LVLEGCLNKIIALSSKYIHKDALQFGGYIFGIEPDKSVNQNTDGVINWNFYYGIEGYSENQELFQIHHRQTIPYLK